LEFYIKKYIIKNGEKSMRFVYENAIVTKIIDGDTVDVSIDLGFDITVNKRVRFYGINAYETRGEEKPLGLLAKQHLIDIMPVGSVITLHSLGVDKYGRCLGDLYYNGLHINQDMIDKGHAVEYYC
jgi:Micrococcal nuclease (thermonuclease) homologs